MFFLLGFTLFALIYASMGSFVSRPDDLQTLSLPLSFVAVAGYLSAILALSGGGGTWTTIASFLPPFSPFVMLARLMIGAVPPWQVALSIGILIVSIVFVAIVGDPDVRGRRPALRPAPRRPSVHRGGPQGGVGARGRARGRPLARLPDAHPR